MNNNEKKNQQQKFKMIKLHRKWLWFQYRFLFHNFFLYFVYQIILCLCDWFQFFSILDNPYYTRHQDVSICFFFTYLFLYFSFILQFFSRETKVARNLSYNHNATLIKLIKKKKISFHTTGRSCRFNDDQ